ncbi:MAG: APC family permease [Candidatus Marsarchaeota archaeon]|nr:APC family permease [Candidatus Marsarchaeota archaeon]
MIEKPRLKRGLTLLDAVMFGVGGAIGSGWLFAAATSSGYAGPAEVLSWLIAAIMIIIITLPYAEYGAMLRSAGVSARFGYFSHGKYAGFLGGWALFLWTVMIPPIEAVAVAEYAYYYLPWIYNPATGLLTPAGVGVAILLMLFFMALNYAGINYLGRFNTALTFLKVIVPLVTIVLAFAFLFHSGNFVSYHGGFAPFGLSGIVIAIPATGILFSYGGYRQVADMAGEIKDPQRNVPRAVIATLLIQSVVYVLASASFVGAINWSKLGITPGDWSSIASLGSPYATLFKAGAASVTGTLAALLSAWVIILLVTAIYSPAGTLGLYLTGGARIIYGFSEMKTFPSVFTRITRRGAPWNALILTFILGVLFMVPYPSWVTLVDFVVVAASANFALAAVSLPALRTLYADAERPFKLPAARAWSFVAFVASSLLIYWATWPVAGYALTATLAGTVIYAYYHYTQKLGSQHIKSGIWFPVFLIFIMVMSYVGGKPTGGLGVIPYPYDILVLVLVDIVFYVWGVMSRLEKREIEIPAATE